MNAQSAVSSGTWHLLALDLPPEVYGAPAHPKGMAQPWGRWALSLIPADSQVPVRAWIGRGPSVVSWGPTIEFTGTLEAASADYRAWAAALDVDEGVRPFIRALGAFNYSDLSGKLEVPTLALWGQPYLETYLLWHDSRADEAAALISAAKSAGPVPHLAGPQAQWQQAGASLPGTEWQQQVAQAISAMQAGQAQKVVLSRDVFWQADRPVPVEQVLAALVGHDDHEGQDASAWAFAVGDLVGASPEILAQVHEGRFFARILAGTRPAGRGEELWQDPKELAEHEAARASVIRRLESAGISEILAPPARLLKLPQVEHLQSEVSGHCEGRDVAQLAAHFHPTAAICGQPTVAAAALIEQLEGMDRGAFAGPVGWMDPAGDGQFNIALRCAQVPESSLRSPQKWRLLAGAGIMPSSVPANEFSETGTKMGTMRSALGID
ncbi:hypothetical protein BSR28_05810 [Boudabousia liubingyangii]|uniref:isochorismate synthase n=1 Tax=Boudabousia liubingyangii TaxID=1921764 RepID=UPI00093B4A2E|nr:chorismate-binding protein [Boudabousia liubingyangii]OKL46937.1 hypothetical protein BSR28_05810 [Boudabousia liubingyangii]